MKKKFFFNILFVFVFCTPLLYSQQIPNEAELDAADSFGFDTQESDDDKFSVTVGGKLFTGAVLYFSALKDISSIRPSSLIYGSLYIEAKAPLTEAYFGVNLNDLSLGINAENAPVVAPKPFVPAWIDQAYMQVLSGNVVFGGGIKKMSWGKTDLFSVLDVVNPLDCSSMIQLSYAERKIGAPLLYFSAYCPHEIKIETVFLPMFEPNRTALSQRWISLQAERLKDLGRVNSGGELAQAFYSDTASLKYAHGGGRFTVTLAGRHDLGFQYFYGFLFNQALQGVLLPSENGGKVSSVYTPYHNIGIDYGTVAGNVTLHAEFAANITHDVKGDKPYLYNPFLAWNTGFEYSAPYNLVLAAQGSGTIRLMNKHITDNDDAEMGTKPSSSKLLFSISQTLLRRSFEWKILTVIGIEDADFIITPSINWQFGTLLMDIRMGFFGGFKKGSFGRYRKNSFIKLGLGYQF